MKKSKNIELDKDTLERIVSMALEEKKPFEVLKNEFDISEREVTEIMRNKLTAENFELWKKKVAGKKPKPKPLSKDDLDDDLGSKYYIKNKLD